MSSYDTYILESGDAIYGAGETFYTAISVLSAHNFQAVQSLSSTYTEDFAIGYDIDETTFDTISSAMPTASAVDLAVYNTGAFFTSASAGVTHVNFISAGTINGKTVTALTFNKLADDLDALESTTTTLSAFDGVKFEVNDAYDGAEIAFVFDDRTGTTLTVAISSGESSSQDTSSTTTHINTPELRRLWRHGYI